MVYTVGPNRCWAVFLQSTGTEGDGGEQKDGRGSETPASTSEASNSARTAEPIEGLYLETVVPPKEEDGAYRLVFWEIYCSEK